MSHTSQTPGHGAYAVRIRGHLDPRWAAQFGVPSLSHEADGTTIIRGVTADQAALHGLLQRIRDLGVTLVSVNRDPSNQPDDPSTGSA